MSSSFHDFNSGFFSSNRYTAEENFFIREHLADKDLIQICFNWMYDHKLNANEEFMRCVKENYKTLAPKFKKITIESRDTFAYSRPVVDHSFNAVVFKKLLTDDLNNSTETKQESFDETNFKIPVAFPIAKKHLLRLQELLAPLNTFTPSLNTLLAHANQVLPDATINLTGTNLETYLRLTRLFCWWELSAEGIHEIFSETTTGEAQLNISRSHLNNLINWINESAPNFSQDKLQVLFTDDNDEIYLTNARLSLLKEIIENIEELDNSPPESQCEYKSAQPEISVGEINFLESITPFENVYNKLFADIKNLCKEIFGVSIAEGMFFSNWMTTSTLTLLCSVPANKVGDLYCAINDYHVNVRKATLTQYNGDLLRQWTLEKTPEQVRLLGYILGWMNKNNLASQDNLSFIGKHVKHIDPHQFYYFTFSEEADQNFKNNIFDSYREHILTLSMKPKASCNLLF